MHGLADVTTTPPQGLPLATVNQYEAPPCGFGQKMVGTGPFTCAFDLATAFQQAWMAPGVYLSMVPGIGSLPPNALSALAWGAVAWFFLFRGGGKHG
jgi:hypothetical protein